MWIAALAVGGACSSGSADSAFARFPSLDGAVEVLYYQSLRQSPAGEVVACEPVLEEFTCVPVLRVEGIDLSQFDETTPVGSNLWLDGHAVRGVLREGVLTVDRVIAIDDASTGPTPLPDPRQYTCNDDAPRQALSIEQLSEFSFALVRSTGIAGEHHAAAQRDGRLVVRTPILTREQAVQVCEGQALPVIIYQYGDLAVCVQDLPCRFDPLGPQIIDGDGRS